MLEAAKRSAEKSTASEQERLDDAAQQLKLNLTELEDLRKAVIEVNAKMGESGLDAGADRSRSITIQLRSRSHQLLAELEAIRNDAKRLKGKESDFVQQLADARTQISQLVAAQSSGDVAKLSVERQLRSALMLTEDLFSEFSSLCELVLAAEYESFQDACWQEQRRLKESVSHESRSLMAKRRLSTDATAVQRNFEVAKREVGELQQGNMALTNEVSDLKSRRDTLVKLCPGNPEAWKANWNVAVLAAFDDRTKRIRDLEHKLQRAGAAEKELAEERQASFEKQAALDELVEELKASRAARDHEVQIVKEQFEGAKRSWEQESVVVLTKLATLQGLASGSTICIPAAPASEGLEKAAASLFDDANAVSAQELTTWAAQLCGTDASEEPSLLASKLKRFFTWGLETVVPLCASVKLGSVLEMVVWIVGNHVQFITAATTLLGLRGRGVDDNTNDLLFQMRSALEELCSLQRAIDEAPSGYGAQSRPAKVCALGEGAAMMSEVSRALQVDQANVLGRLHELLFDSEHCLELKEAACIPTRTAPEPLDEVSDIVEVLRQNYRDLNDLFDTAKTLLSEISPKSEAPTTLREVVDGLRSLKHLHAELERCRNDLRLALMTKEESAASLSQTLSQTRAERDELRKSVSTALEGLAPHVQNDDLELVQVSLAASEKIARLSRDHEASAHAAAMLSADLNAAQQELAQARELITALRRSGSVSDEKLSEALTVMRVVLSDLAPDDGTITNDDAVLLSALPKAAKEVLAELQAKSLTIRSSADALSQGSQGVSDNELTNACRSAYLRLQRMTSEHDSLHAQNKVLRQLLWDVTAALRMDGVGSGADDESWFPQIVQRTSDLYTAQECALSELRQARNQAGIQSKRLVDLTDEIAALNARLDESTRQLVDQERQSTMRSREHKKEADSLRLKLTNLEETIATLEMDKDDQAAVFNAKIQEQARAREELLDAIDSQKRHAAEELEAAVAHSAEIEAQREAVAKRSDSTRKEYQILLSIVGAASVDHAVKAIQSLQHASERLVVEGMESNSRRMIDAKHADTFPGLHLITGAAASASRVATVLNASAFDTLPALVDELCRSEQMLRQLCGDPTSARHVTSNRQQLIHAVRETLVVLGAADDECCAAPDVALLRTAKKVLDTGNDKDSLCILQAAEIKKLREDVGMLRSSAVTALLSVASHTRDDELGRHAEDLPIVYLSKKLEQRVEEALYDLNRFRTLAHQTCVVLSGSANYVASADDALLALANRQVAQAEDLRDELAAVRAESDELHRHNDMFMQSLPTVARTLCVQSDERRLDGPIHSDILCHVIIDGAANVVSELRRFQRIETETLHHLRRECSSDSVTVLEGVPLLVDKLRALEATELSLRGQLSRGEARIEMLLAEQRSVEARHAELLEQQESELKKEILQRRDEAGKYREQLAEKLKIIARFEGFAQDIAHAARITTSSPDDAADTTDSKLDNTVNEVDRLRQQAESLSQTVKLQRQDLKGLSETEEQQRHEQQQLTAELEKLRQEHIDLTRQESLVRRDLKRESELRLKERLELQDSINELETVHRDSIASCDRRYNDVESALNGQREINAEMQRMYDAQVTELGERIAVLSTELDVSKQRFDNVTRDIDRFLRSVSATSLSDVVAGVGTLRLSLSVLKLMVEEARSRCDLLMREGTTAVPTICGSSHSALVEIASAMQLESLADVVIEAKSRIASERVCRPLCGDVEVGQQYSSTRADCILAMTDAIVMMGPHWLQAERGPDLHSRLLNATAELLATLQSATSSETSTFNELQALREDHSTVSSSMQRSLSLLLRALGVDTVDPRTSPVVVAESLEVTVSDIIAVVHGYQASLRSASSQLFESRCHAVDTAVPLGVAGDVSKKYNAGSIHHDAGVSASCKAVVAEVLQLREQLAKQSVASDTLRADLAAAVASISHAVKVIPSVGAAIESIDVSEVRGDEESSTDGTVLLLQLERKASSIAKAWGASERSIADAITILTDVATREIGDEGYVLVSLSLHVAELVRSLSSQIELSSLTAKRMEQKLNETRDDLVASDAEHERQLADARESFKASDSTLRQQLELRQDQLTSMERRSRMLFQAMSDISSSVHFSWSEASTETCEGLVAQIRELSSTADSSAHSNKTLRSEIRLLQQRVTDLDTELNTTMTERERIVVESTEEQRHQSSTIKQLSQQIDALHGELETTREELVLSQRAYSTSREAAEAAIDELRRRIDAITISFKHELDQEIASQQQLASELRGVTEEKANGDEHIRELQTKQTQFLTLVGCEHYAGVRERLWLQSSVNDQLLLAALEAEQRAAIASAQQQLYPTLIVTQALGRFTQIATLFPSVDAENCIGAVKELVAHAAAADALIGDAAVGRRSQLTRSRCLLAMRDALAAFGLDESTESNELDTRLVEAAQEQTIILNDRDTVASRQGQESRRLTDELSTITSGARAALSSLRQIVKDSELDPTSTSGLSRILERLAKTAAADSLEQREQLLQAATFLSSVHPVTVTISSVAPAASRAASECMQLREERTRLAAVVDDLNPQLEAMNRTIGELWSVLQCSVQTSEVDVSSAMDLDERLSRVVDRTTMICAELKRYQRIAADAEHVLRAVIVANPASQTPHNTSLDSDCEGANSSRATETVHSLSIVVADTVARLRLELENAAALNKKLELRIEQAKHELKDLHDRREADGAEREAAEAQLLLRHREHIEKMREQSILALRDISTLAGFANDIGHMLRADVAQQTTSVVDADSLAVIVTRCNELRENYESANNLIRTLRLESKSLQGRIDQLIAEKSSLELSLEGVQQNMGELQRTTNTRAREQRKECDQQLLTISELERQVTQTQSMADARDLHITQLTQEINKARGEMEELKRCHSRELAEAAEAGEAKADAIQAELENIKARYDSQSRSVQGFLRHHDAKELAGVSEMMYELIGLVHSLRIDLEETQERRRVEAAFYDLLNISGVTRLAGPAASACSILAVRPEALPESTRTLSEAHLLLKQLVGDPSIGRKGGVSRSDCFNALAEIILLLKGPVEANRVTATPHVASSAVQCVNDLLRRSDLAANSSTSFAQQLESAQGSLSLLMNGIVGLYPLLQASSDKPLADITPTALLVQLEQRVSEMRKRIIVCDEIVLASRRAVAIATYDGSTPNDASLADTIYRVANDCNNARAANVLLNEELDAVRADCDVFTLRLPPVLRLLVDNSEAPLPTAPVHLCATLLERATLLKDEYIRLLKQATEASASLAAVLPADLKGPVHILALTAAERIRELTSANTTATKSSKQFEEKLEQTRQELVVWQERHETFVSVHERSVKEVDLRNRDQQESLRDEVAGLQRENNRLKEFALDIARSLREEVRAMDFAGCSQVVRVCDDMRAALESTKQGLKVAVDERDDARRQLQDMHRSLASAEQRLDECQRLFDLAKNEAEAADRLAKRDLQSVQFEREEFSKQYLAERRDKEAKTFELSTQISELHTALQRIGDECRVPAQAANRSKPSLIVEAVHNRIRQLEDERDGVANDGASSRLALQREIEERQHGIEELLTRLEIVTSERDLLKLKEDNLIAQLQKLMSDNHDMFQSWLPSTETITVFAITDNCVSQLNRKHKQLQQLEQRLQTSEHEAVKLSSELRTTREENARLAAHRQELMRDVNKTQNSAHAAQVDAASLSSELDSLKTTVMGVFAFACDIAQTELKVKAASLPDRTATAALGGIRAILSLVADRFRNCATPEEIESSQAELVKVINAEKGRVQSLERSLQEFDQRVLPYVKSAVPKGSHSPIQEASEGLHMVRQSVAQATVNLATFLQCPISDDVRSGDLVGFARLVDELSAEAIRKSLRILDITTIVSESLGLQRLDVTATPAQLRAWADMIVGTFARGRNEADQVADRLADLVGKYGGSKSANVSRNTSFARERSSSTEQGLQFSSISHTTSTLHQQQLSSAARGSLQVGAAFDRQLNLLHEMEEILRGLVSQQLQLTSQWQGLHDQSQRLSLEKQTRDSEHDRLKEHIIQLRAIVQKKLLDDKNVEEQMKQLDYHLDSQAKELATKYQMDRDLIVRRFSDLRGAIHRMIRPQQQNPSAVPGSSRSSSFNGNN